MEKCIFYKSWNPKTTSTSSLLGAPAVVLLFTKILNRQDYVLLPVFPYLELRVLAVRGLSFADSQLVVVWCRGPGPKVLAGDVAAAAAAAAAARLPTDSLHILWRWWHCQLSFSFDSDSGISGRVLSSFAAAEVQVQRLCFEKSAKLSEFRKRFSQKPVCNANFFRV